MAIEAELYKRFNKGDVLTDKELSALQKHFRELYLLLLVSGPVFHLACNEAGRVEQRCAEYLQARKER